MGEVEGAGLGSEPREVGDRLLSVTRSIERELESLRGVGAEQERREIGLAERELGLVERERELGARDGAVGERAASLEAREAVVAQAEVQAEEDRRGLEAERREVREATERLAGQKKVLRDREQTVGEREATCELRESELSALQATVGSGAEAARRIAELEGTAQGIEAELMRRVSELEEGLRHAREESAGVAEERGNFEREIARRDEALEILQGRLREAVGRLEASPGPALLRKGEGVGGGGGVLVVEEFNAVRRERLRRLRGLLEERARKVIRAREALAKRAQEIEEARSMGAGAQEAESEERRRLFEGKMAEAETALAMRASLAEQEEALRAQARRLAARSSKGTAGVLAAALGVMLAASLVGGWALAGNFARSEYLARATIAMEETGERHTAEEVGSWGAFHEALVSDPQLVERASERMRRRGYVELGTPAALAARLREDLEVQAGARGELTLTLRGEGLSRTENVLDTFAGALVQMGNDARDRRLDRVSAVVKSGARAETAPIVDGRMPMFGAIAGGLAGMSMMAWMVAWRTLARRPVTLGGGEMDEGNE